MRWSEHRACGFSEFAPGCDDWWCLVHRIEVGQARGWDVAFLQQRLDSQLAAAVDGALHSLLPTDAPEPAPRRSRRD